MLDYNEIVIKSKDSKLLDKLSAAFGHQWYFASNMEDFLSDKEEIKVPFIRRERSMACIFVSGVYLTLGEDQKNIEEPRYFIVKDSSGWEEMRWDVNPNNQDQKRIYNSALSDIYRRGSFWAEDLYFGYFWSFLRLSKIFYINPTRYVDIETDRLTEKYTIKDLNNVAQPA